MNGVLRRRTPATSQCREARHRNQCIGQEQIATMSVHTSKSLSCLIALSDVCSSGEELQHCGRVHTHDGIGLGVESREWRAGQTTGELTPSPSCNMHPFHGRRCGFRAPHPLLYPWACLVVPFTNTRPQSASQTLGECGAHKHVPLHAYAVPNSLRSVQCLTHHPPQGGNGIVCTMLSSLNSVAAACPSQTNWDTLKLLPRTRLNRRQ